MAEAKTSFYTSKQSAQTDAKILRKKGYKSKITHMPKRDKHFTWKLQISKIKKLTQRGARSGRSRVKRGRKAASKRGSQAFRRRR
jgi:uncharacterized protein (DUF2147 family)